MKGFSYLSRSENYRGRKDFAYMHGLVPLELRRSYKHLYTKCNTWNTVYTNTNTNSYVHFEIRNAIMYHFHFLVSASNIYTNLFILSNRTFTSMIYLRNIWPIFQSFTDLIGTLQCSGTIVLVFVSGYAKHTQEGTTLQRKNISPWTLMTVFDVFW